MSETYPKAKTEFSLILEKMESQTRNDHATSSGAVRRAADHNDPTGPSGDNINPEQNEVAERLRRVETELRDLSVLNIDIEDDRLRDRLYRAQSTYGAVAGRLRSGFDRDSDREGIYHGYPRESDRDVDREGRHHRYDMRSDRESDR